MVLSSEDNLLFLANHLSKQDTQLLRFLGDIAELLRKYNGHLDWDYIIESAHSWQVEATVYYSLKRARDILGAPVPAYSLDTLKPSTWRRWVLDFLLSPEAFVSINRNRLVSETSVLARSLMMKHTHQILTVLSRYRGSGKKGAWLRTAIWIMLVFIVGLGRNGIKIASRRQGRVL
jgi:hypothetical protein